MGNLKISMDRSCADTPDSYLNSSKRVGRLFLFFNSFLRVLFNSISSVVSDSSPDCIFSACLFFSFLISSFEIGFKMALSFFFFFFFAIHFSVVRMTIEAFRSSSSMLFVLHCRHCVELLSLVHFRSVCFLFFFSVVIFEQYLWDLIADGIESLSTGSKDIERDYSIKTSAVVFCLRSGTKPLRESVKSKSIY